MPIIRSAAIASATMARYLGSKMCSGRHTFGKRTTLCSGKSGRRSDISRSLMYGFCFLVHVVHQHVLTKGVGRREVRLPLADFGDSAHEAHQVVVAREHECVDHDP